MKAKNKNKKKMKKNRVPLKFPGRQAQLESLAICRIKFNNVGP